ncbi:MAG: phosphotransferase [Corynebacterium sp.]|uniref:phosphotransferase n=1 Tax=Corynebacterium sp. TaxID=1720 RepID=UPI0026DBC886|nr:phosphotransferase [Corynebacterium sp.]MDO5099259.1 phosphotransferase [Corynebacterium sp.]
MIHGDPSYPNLRLGQSRELCGVIDWESVRWGIPLRDLAVVGQSVLYRSGWGDVRDGLKRLLDVYGRAGGRTYSIHQLLITILSIKFWSIENHGQVLLNGGGDVDLVRSQAEKIAAVCRLLQDEPV